MSEDYISGKKLPPDPPILRNNCLCQHFLTKFLESAKNKCFCTLDMGVAGNSKTQELVLDV